MKYLIALSFLFSVSIHCVEMDAPAPSFSLAGSPKAASLQEYEGKYVVLEWFNDGCPFVRKHYDTKNMQMTQKKYEGKVAWLTINSSAPGKQGYLANAEMAKEKYTKEQMHSISLLLDSNGSIGQEYGAKTTPHMFIIDPKGKVVYQGAIDSVASTSSSDIPKATNYVSKALDEALSGKRITMAKTKPYGCSVKY